MSILTILRGGDLESFYYQVLDQLDAIYHTHPTSLQYMTYEDIKQDPPSGYDEIAGEAYNSSGMSSQVPLGKLIL